MVISNIRKLEEHILESIGTRKDLDSYIAETHEQSLP